MGLRHMILRILDRIAPETPNPTVLAQCPSCRGDLWRRNASFRIDNDLTFVRCVCGHASAWLVNGHGPQLIFTGEPEEIDDD